MYCSVDGKLLFQDRITDFMGVSRRKCFNKRWIILLLPKIEDAKSDIS